jgi:purine-nucleoside phosphorylase
MSTDQEELAAALAFIQERCPPATVGLILGSGLGALADVLTDASTIPTSDIPHFPVSSVEGHAGHLVVGQLAGKMVAVLRGRVHMYEGHDARRVTFPVRLLHGLGVRHLIVTNAAGGVNPAFLPGTLMFIDDHINFAFANPLVGPNTGEGPRFPDMSAPYDRAWLDRAEAVALREGIPTTRGVYLWTMGPSYETKAEIRAFSLMGADAVGMSTVPEVIQAAYLGMSVLGLSTITNPAAGLSPRPLAHNEVIEVGNQVRSKLQRLVTSLVSDTAS